MFMELTVRDRVIREASTLFVLNGIKSVTMNTIAGKVGISKRTLYETFEDKDRLLIACIVHMGGEEDKRYMELARNCNNSIEILLVVYKEMLERIRYTNRNYFSDLKRYHPAVMEYFSSQKKHRNEDAIKLMEMGMQEGYFRADLKVEIVTLLLNAQFELLMNSDSMIAVRYSFMEIFETIFMNFVRGIATPAGLMLIDDFVEKKLKK